MASEGSPNIELRTGRLLVATPILDDPSFWRTVVLLCSHDDEGSLGLVLNRPLESAVLDLVPEWRSFVASPQVVFSGGPVDELQGFALGRSDRVYEEPWWQPITPGVGMLGSEGDPTTIEGVEHLRIFAGYAGWGGGQLEEELGEEAWFVVDPRPEDVFSPHPERLWHEVLARQRGELRLYAHFPPDPRYN